MYGMTYTPSNFQLICGHRGPTFHLTNTTIRTARDDETYFMCLYLVTGEQ